MNGIFDQAQAYLAAIVTSSDDAIVGKDLKGNIVSWNPAAERIFGYVAAEAVGRHITLIIPSDRLAEEDTILATLKRGERVDHFETVRRHKDGHLVPVSLTVSPIRDKAGKVIGASKIARDISDRINAEEALKESNRKKDEFLANMSHELRTPMGAVIGLANLLKAIDTLPDNAKKFVETLKMSADNLMDLINDLLDFAKIESDSMTIETIEFSLAEQVEKAVSLTAVNTQAKGLALYANYAFTLSHHYRGDPLRIHQVLMNLLSNAVKFTEKGSIEIDINGTPDPATDTTFITIEVSDTGIGIAADKLETIFEKFVQADSSMTRRYGGSGLGLAITKALVEKMGGAIHVESEPQIGTTFRVTLPLKNSQQSPAQQSLPLRRAPKAPTSVKNILVVEDYHPNLLVAGTMLEALGYDYDIAFNGFEAIKKFMRGHYDMILMDVQMHDLDGLEATRRIRRMEAEKGLPRIPIIALTAHVREQDKNKCLEAGMDDFIPKPFEPTALAEKIARYVNAGKEKPKKQKVPLRVNG